MKLTWKRIMLSSNEVFVNISLLFKLKFLLLQGPISRCEIIRFKWEDLKANYLFFFDHDIKIFQINRCITKPKTNQIIFFLLRKVIFLLKFGRKIIHYKNLIFQVSAIIYEFVAIHYLLTHQKLVSITENMLNRGFQFHAKGLLKWYIWFDTISPS